MLSTEDMTQRISFPSDTFRFSVPNSWVASSKEKAEPKGRLARSSSCRNWYHLRQEARKTGVNPPLWVITSPPWQVLTLALKMAGKPAITAFLLYPMGLLAGSGDDIAESQSQETSEVFDKQHDRALGKEFVSAVS